VAYALVRAASRLSRRLILNFFIAHKQASRRVSTRHARVRRTSAYATKTWYRGRGSNSTASVCRTEALSQKATPAYLAVGAGFEPAHKLVNSQPPCRLATPQKIWSGTSDSNRDSLGPRPSGLIHFPSPRIAKIWSERLESNQRPRASETRALIPLSYAHKHWNRRPELNRHFFVRTEVFSPLNDARVISDHIMG
jgi:hypothetical protein